MRCVALSEAGDILSDLCEAALRNREEVLLTHKHGNLVLLPEDDWEMTRETLGILRDKLALLALLEGHQIRDEGRVPPGRPAEEVFSDLADQHSLSP